MFVGLVAGLGLAGIAATIRIRQLRRMTAITNRRRRLGPDGIVIGGDGFELSRANAPAVLMLHGGGDTPQTLRYLGKALHDCGFHVVAPLLPGHGRRLSDFRRVDADQLARAAEEAYRALRATHEWVAVVGLSMGGALAVQLAANHPSIPCLGLLAPYLSMPPRIERWAKIWWLWGMVLPAVNAAEGTSIFDEREVQRNLAYGVFTPRALRALQQTAQRAAAALPHVVSPTLFVQSREDNRISVDAAAAAFARLGAREKELVWVTGAAHIITVDFGRDQISKRLASFLESHVAPRQQSSEQFGLSK